MTPIHWTTGRRRRRTGCFALCMTAVVLFAPRLASAQLPFEVLHAFAGETAIGSFGYGALVQASDGNFYGTTGAAGAYNAGTIFRVTPNGTFVRLYSFTGGLDGRDPSPLIQATDGNLYGTTFGGGVGYGEGTIFRMTLAGIVTTMYAFPGRPGGAEPNGPLLQASDGNLYGTTYVGGTGSVGTIFRMTLAGSVTILHSISFNSEGFGPHGLVQGTDGNLYGSDQPVIFRVTLDGTFTVLRQVTGEADPSASLTQALDGNFYGTTTNGGALGYGTVFRMTPLGAVTVVHTFTGGVDGGALSAALTLAGDGSLYGITSGGTLGRGGVFRITTAGDFRIVHAFTGGLDGSVPTTYSSASLTKGTDGNFYGTTSAEGAFAQGTLFRMSPDGVVTTLHAFQAGPDGAYPDAGLLRASDGNYYGTTSVGGAYDHGAIFRMTPSGAFSILYTFTGGLDGGHPRASLTEGNDGRLWGTTYDNGAYNLGVAFQVTTSGEFTILHGFQGGSDGAYPSAALVQARDGNFYGTTLGGGTGGHGTAFRMTRDGVVTVLHSFAGDADGAQPIASLVQAPDGNFYGTTSTDGRFHSSFDLPCPYFGHGTIFRLSPTGVTTTLQVFDGTVDGASPQAGLILAADGNLYGTTSGGYVGTNQCSFYPPTVFRVTLAGSLTTLHMFDGFFEGSSAASLLQASDGNFYGTTSSGEDGFLFQMTPSGVTSILHQSSSEAYGPRSFLIQGPDGALYGTTATSGVPFYGTVFRLRLNAPLPPASVTATATAGAHVRVAWATVPNATSYTVRRRLGSGPETVVATGISATSYVDTSVVSGSPYYYEVSASNAFGESANSSETAWGLGFGYSHLDQDGDGKADLAVFRASTGEWFIHRSSDGGAITLGWGAPALGDIPVPADYDGDGKTDIAVYRGSTGEWFIHRSSDGGTTVLGWGAPSLGDIPAPADYDGDGKTDIAVYRGSTGEWFIHRSSDGGMTILGWGAPSLGDIPVPADYDGDGKVDIGVYRGATGEWFIRRSSDGGMLVLNWGSPDLGDVPVLADYDGDGKADLAVYRGTTGEWLIHRSSDGGTTILGWGAPGLGDIPVPADYDGDGKTDIAVYRGSTGEWFIHRSSDGGATSLDWGAPALDDRVVRADPEADLSKRS